MSAAEFLQVKVLGRKGAALLGEYVSGSRVFVYNWPQCALTVDIAVFSRSSRQVLLIERAADPCKGSWALPGGFVDIDHQEETEHAAYRELEEETNIPREALPALVHVGAYAGPHRDTRGYSCTFAYAAVVEDRSVLNVRAGDDARNAQWFELDKLPSLAFDHARILNDAVHKLDL
jgi:8-oxo-dGTP diphosphatase